VTTTEVNEVNEVEARRGDVTLDADATSHEPGQPGSGRHQPEAVFDTYIAPEVDFVRRVSRRFSHNQADADDLAQDVLTNAYRAADRFDGRYPRAWLYRIASNAAASRARKRVPVLARSDDLALDDQAGPESSSPEEILIDPMLDATLAAALDTLPEHYREVVDLVDVGGLSYEDAAEALAIPMGTVMSRLHRGRRRLRDALAGTHLDRHGARATVAPPV
jgi:RNA polymerase sigma-70 factor (ECF subfamily)